MKPLLVIIKRVGYISGSYFCDDYLVYSVKYVILIHILACILVPIQVDGGAA